MLKSLPFWGKIAYGGGAAGWTLLERVILTWLFYFYITSPIEGVEALLGPMAFGFIMFGGRVVDAIADPLVARFSDNFSSRLGRRMPFMLVGGIIYAAAFLALFYPPVAEQSAWNSVHLVFFLGLFYFMFTAYVCPYLALLPELARTKSDRVDLSTSKAVFTMLGAGVAMLGSSILLGYTDFHTMIWIMALIALIFLYIPALIKEKDYAEAQPADMGLLDAVKTTFQNRPFRIYLVGSMALWFGFNIISLNLPLYVTELLGRPEEDMAVMFAAWGTAVVAFFLINLLAKKWGLKFVMLIAMIVFVVSLPLLYFMVEPFWNIPPTVLWFFSMGLAGFSIAGVLIVPDAIVATISDMEEKITGQRREAMYYGVQGFFLKLTIGISTIVTGGLVEFFGRPLGVQLTGPAAALIILLGAIFFLRYPEQEVMQASEEIQSSLE